MHSLVFLCAQKVVSHHATLHGALGFLPKELYPVLFKAAFMDKRTLALQDLVQTWPFPVLSFQKLLRKCQHCERALIREKPNKLCIQTIILGVVTYLIKMLEERQSSKRYAKAYVNPVWKGDYIMTGVILFYFFTALSSSMFLPVCPSGLWRVTKHKLLQHNTDLHCTAICKGAICAVCVCACACDARPAFRVRNNFLVLCLPLELATYCFCPTTWLRHPRGISSREKTA